MILEKGLKFLAPIGWPQLEEGTWRVLRTNELDINRNDPNRSALLGFIP